MTKVLPFFVSHPDFSALSPLPVFRKEQNSNAFGWIVVCKVDEKARKPRFLRAQLREEKRSNMKIEKFSLRDKGALFANAHAMHDCNFTVAYENQTLILTYDKLDQYYDGPPLTPWFENEKKLTIRYHGIDHLRVDLSYGKKAKWYIDSEAVDALAGKELEMYKYSVDSFGKMTLDFWVMIKRSQWAGSIEIRPDEIEYIWE